MMGDQHGSRHGLKPLAAGSKPERNGQRGACNGRRGCQRSKRQPGPDPVQPLRTHRQQRHQLPGFLRCRFGLLSVKLAPPLHLVVVACMGTGLLAPALAETGFGRWESLLRSCQLSWPREGPQPALLSSCLSVRLDQTIAGMLRVRFINAGKGSRYASEELSFAGLLLRQDEPMNCQQGSCQPHWPMRLQVQSVATRRFDARGIAQGLPLNQLAQGSCRLSGTTLWCEARDGWGLRWSANAQLRPLDPAAPAAGKAN